MSILKSVIPNSTKDFIRLSMIGATVLIIVFLFPKHIAFDSDFVEGDVWQDESLLAVSDFEVDKTPQQSLLAERKVNEAFVPLFEKKETKEGMLKSLGTKMDEFYETINDDTRAEVKSKVLNHVSGLYDKGIIIYDPDNAFNNGKFLLNDELSTPDQYLELSKAKNGISKFFSDNKLEFYEEELSIIDQHIQANIILDEKRTESSYVDALSKAKDDKYKVLKGDTIVRKGDIIDQTTYYKLNALKSSASGVAGTPTNWLKFFGYLLLTCLIIGALILFCMMDFPIIFRNLNNLGFILMWPVILSVLVYYIDKTDNLSSYMIPFCIVPIIVKNFFNDRLALFLHIVIILIASFLSKLGYEFTFLQILAGIITVLFVSETRYWNRFFIAILIIFMTYFIGYFGLSAIKANSIYDIPWSNFGWLGLSSFLILLAYPFIPLIERLFGFTSSITLAELSDMNNPLLKRMSIEAPGTLQHSLQVSNLSEAAADKIGANSLLIKAAALYHDIGKLNNPEAYIENQPQVNPHDSWNNFESAKAIINHVIEGEAMAKKARLPKVLIDFITTHHGNTRVEYFYRNQLKAEPDREFDESLFRYPGPLPFSKEQTILMIADSLEAASKSLKSPTGKDIDDLVDKIIAYKIDNGQLEDSQLSFTELEECKNVFKSLLRSINHVRVEYPDEVKTPQASINDKYADKSEPSQ